MTHTIDQGQTHPTEYNESKGESAQDPYGLKLNSEDEWPINEVSLQKQSTMSERNKNKGENQAHSSSIPTHTHTIPDDRLSYHVDDNDDLMQEITHKDSDNKETLKMKRK